MKVDGILLCGGRGTRLLPTTSYLNKHLIPIYDKPMVYYSLSILLMSGIKDISIIHNSNDRNQFEDLLEDGTQFGIKIKYVEQPEAGGIPEAINLATEEGGESKTVTVLGDNFIFGEKFYTKLEEIINNTEMSSIFSQVVKSPEEFGVVQTDSSNKIVNIVEKPKEFISNLAVIGLYVFDSSYKNHFKNIKKSERGEFEIIDIVKSYGLENVNHNYIGRGTAWFDMGTTNSFYKCSSFVKTIQDEQGLLVCSPHEIALRNGWVDKNHLSNYLDSIKDSEYSENLQYLMR